MFEGFSRDDWMVGAGGLLLAITLLFFPWFSVSAGGFTATAVATSSSGGIWAVLALIVLVALVVDFALARFSPATQVPTTALGREMTRAAGAGLVALLLVIKFLAHTSNFGWGFFAAIILTAIVAAGAWMGAQAAPMPAREGSEITV